MIDPRRAAGRLVQPAAVLGIGNVLLGDDGVGPTVVAMLAAAYRLPPQVALLDVGTPGIDLADYLAGLHTAILVDSVRTGGPPGTRWRIGRAGLLAGDPSAGSAGVRRAGHDPALRDTLLALELCGRAPVEVVLFGVVPESTVTGAALSDVVRAAAQAAAGDVVAELRRLGYPVAARRPARQPDLWWERRESHPASA